MGRLTHLYEPGMTYLITTITQRRQKLFADTESPPRHECQG
ncbi:MAG: hypothetical protein Fur0044_51880 [Anaerolineae bacterium]